MKVNFGLTNGCSFVRGSKLYNYNKAYNITYIKKTDDISLSLDFTYKNNYCHSTHSY